MKIAGVVVLYNPDENVKKNIDSYINNLDILYVVDNSPEPNDNSKYYKGKKIKYISNHGNKGIAYALNVGAKEAIKTKNEWLLTMDQDSSFKGDSLSKMIAFLKEIKNNSFICETLSISYEKLGILSTLQRTELNRNNEEKGISYPLVVMTSGNLINLNIYKEVGGFKDWLFIDAVDFDYCLNVRKHRYEIVQMSTAELIHNLGNVEKHVLLGKTMFATNHNANRRYYITRNRHYLYDLYHSEFEDYCKLEVGRTKKELIKILLFEKNKFAKIKAIYMGYRDYKKGIKGEKVWKDTKRKH